MNNENSNQASENIVNKQPVNRAPSNTIDSSNKPKVEMPKSSISGQSTNSLPNENVSNNGNMPIKDVDNNVQNEVSSDKQPSDNVSSEIPKAEEHYSFAGTDQVIKQVKPEKAKGGFGIFVIFVILIGFIFFLPELSPYIEEYINKYTGKPVATNQNNESTEEKVEEKVEEKQFYSISSNPEIKMDDLIFSKFVINRDELVVTLEVNNSSKTTYDFTKKYFIELYNDEKTLLNRVMIYSDIAIASGQTSNISLPVKPAAIGATQISIVNITENEYPNIEVSDNQILVCHMEENNIRYDFNNGKLYNISDEATIYQEDDEEFYESAKEAYIRQVESSGSINGLNFSIVTNADNFVVTTIVDLKTISSDNLSKLKRYKYYKLNKELKVVNFEMEASGYDCNLEVR